MGMRVLIIEIDSVLADTAQRFAQARNYTLSNGGLGLGEDSRGYKKIFYSEQGYFNPVLVSQDEMTLQAPFLWELQEYMDYTVVLSSRPDWLQGTTVNWLQEKGLWNSNRMTVITKDYGSKVKYLKTEEWYVAWLEQTSVFAHITLVHPLVAVRQEAARVLGSSGTVTQFIKEAIVYRELAQVGWQKLDYQQQFTVAAKMLQAEQLQDAVRELYPMQHKSP